MSSPTQPLPTSTRAAILVEQRKPLVVARIGLPDHLDVGQVLVRIHCSGVCGSQLGEIEGVKGPDAFLPHLLGHEGAGTVLATGPGVRHVKPGDTVILHWRKGAGIDAQPPVYSWEGRRVNAGWVTTFNEHAIVSENRVTAIPADTDMEIAALFGCAVTTGFGVVVNNARLTIGESVVVFGAGGVGLNIVQAAAMVSAWPIVAVDLHDNKLELARALGASHVINSASTDARQAIREILGAAGPDVFIDNTGNSAVIQMGFEATKPQGRVVLVGVPRKGTTVGLYPLPLHFGKQLSGSHGGESAPERDIPRYLALHREGRLRLGELVTARFTLDTINDAIDGMRSGRIAGRCMIGMGG
jgi:S-(hydroxymethyl)glutathione dehydrogenase/alcohol dehydrogenase